MSMWHVIDVDLARVYASETKDGFVRAVGWSDGGKVLDVTEKHVEVTEVDLVRGHEVGDPGLRSEVLKVPQHGSDVYTNSGQANFKEAYASRMDAAGDPVPNHVRQA
jgi:hypothetical protein